VKTLLRAAGPAAAVPRPAPQPSTAGEPALVETPQEGGTEADPAPAAQQTVAEPARRTSPDAVAALSLSMRGRSPQRTAGPGPSTGGAAPASEVVRPEDRPIGDANSLTGAAEEPAGRVHVLRGGKHQESAAGSAAREPLRPVETAPERQALSRDLRAEAAADAGEFRQTADDLPSFRMPAAGRGGGVESEPFPDGLAALNRDARSATGSGAVAEAAPDGPSAAPDKESIARTGRTGVFDQIVQRAAVQLKNDHGEISIDLKPDFLGRVRMQISTEHQQVTVRILTELASVRDMIETGLPQLKSELQSQGLQVERLEVAVADDHRQRDWQQAQTAQGWKAAAEGAGPAAEASAAEHRFEPVYRNPRAGGAPTIDTFV
jgi:flagellar hook-length control protein FliK